MKYTHVGMAALIASLLAGCDSGAPSPGPENTNSTYSPVVKETYYSFDGKSLDMVKYEEKNGVALFQGDIVLPLSSDKKSTAGLAHSSAARWDQNGIVVYDLQSMPVELRDNWFLAMRHIALRTSLRFSRDKEIYKNITGYGSAGPIYSPSFIRVVPNNLGFSGGYSSVGRQIGGQDLGLSTNVSAGLIAHELLHAIGHWHEQSRVDRDQHIQINTQNIQPGFEHNFNVHSSDGYMVGGYDYCSLMHYSRFSFSVNGLETITPRNTFSCQMQSIYDQTVQTSSVGQRFGLSNGDIQTVANKYPNVTAKRPFAFAGFDQVISLKTYGSSVTVTLDGSKSFPVEGAGLTYSWKPVGFVQCTNPYPPYYGCSPTNPIQNNTKAVATVAQAFESSPAYPRRSSKQYELTVTDAYGRSMRDIVTVNITGYY